MYVSEHTGSRVHRQSFNHSVERIFLFFLPFFSLLFLTQPSFREARRTITVTRTPRFVISRLPIPLPNYLSTLQTDLFDTDRGHNRRPSAILGSARPRIIAPFHERYRVVVKSTRPVLITARRSIPQLRFFNALSLTSRTNFSDLLSLDRTLNLERTDRRQLLESNSSLRVNHPPPPSSQPVTRQISAKPRVCTLAITLRKLVEKRLYRSSRRDGTPAISFHALAHRANRSVSFFLFFSSSSPEYISRIGSRETNSLETTAFLGNVPQPAFRNRGFDVEISLENIRE